MGNAIMTSFAPRTADKVERLLDLLDEMHRCRLASRMGSRGVRNASSTGNRSSTNSCFPCFATAKILRP